MTGRHFLEELGFVYEKQLPAYYGAVLKGFVCIHSVSFCTYVRAYEKNLNTLLGAS